MLQTPPELPIAARRTPLGEVSSRRGEIPEKSVELSQRRARHSPTRECIVYICRARLCIDVRQCNRRALQQESSRQTRRTRRNSPIRSVPPWMALVAESEDEQVRNLLHVGGYSGSVLPRKPGRRLRKSKGLERP